MSSKRASDSSVFSRKKVKLSPIKCTSKRGSSSVSSRLTTKHGQMQQNLFECYERADKNLVVIRANRSKEKYPIEDLDESTFALESYPTAKIVLMLASVPSKPKLKWMVVMVDDVLPKRPTHWKSLNGIYFKFKLERKTIHARVIREGDVMALIKYFKIFVSKFSTLVNKYVDMTDCVAITNKPIIIDDGAEAEFKYNMISCLESDCWRRDASTSSSNQGTRTTNHDDSGVGDDILIIEEAVKDNSQSRIRPKKCATITGGLTTPLHASTPIALSEKTSKSINKHQPRKSMFFESCNKSQEDLISGIDSKLKDYIFVRETSLNLIKTIDSSDVKKTIFDNLMKLVSIQHDCLANLVQLMKKDQTVQMEIPEHDKTEINEVNSMQVISMLTS